MKGFEKWFGQYVEEKGETNACDGLAFNKEAMQDAFEAGFRKASAAVQKAISEEAENDGAGETATNARMPPGVMELLTRPFPFHGFPKAAKLGSLLKVENGSKALSEMIKKKR